MSVITKNRFNSHINVAVFMYLIIYNISDGYKIVNIYPLGRESDMPVVF